MTTTTTPATELDPLVLAELEQDLEISCEIERDAERCGHPATHWVVCRNCRDQVAECACCYLGLRVVLLRATHIGCRQCGTEIRSISWPVLFEIVPIHLGSA